jgi:nucleosome assembly protein 1-like 1
LDPTDEDECLQRTIGTEIQWKEGKDVTIRVVEKTQKKKGKIRTIKVEEPADSFFGFFEPAEVPDEDDDMDEEEADQLHEQLENDYETGCIIKDRIVPCAVAWFTGAAVDPDEDYDEEDDYGEDDEGEEDDDEDEYDDDEDEDDGEDEDEDEDEDHVDTSRKAKASAAGGAKSGPAGEECKQQ